MRITVFLLIASILQSFASDTYSQTTRLSVNFTNTKLVDVMDEIEKQSEFYFLFNEKLIDTDREVSMSFENKKIDKILDNLFSNTDVVYTITDRKIILAPSFLSANQQQKTITGKVTDEKGLPVPGASIIIKGTTIGVTTDMDGNYTLKIPDEAKVIVFSFVGMKTQEVAIAGKLLINVALETESFGLDEVVAIGYAVQKKATSTGSIVTTGGEKLQRSPALSVSNSLAGLLPGVVAMNRTGEPGVDNSQILIRGLSTTGSNAPLVVVDGVQNPAGWQRINSNDIEQISVLKDASAAIYGSRAANGVIIITTKRGKVGKPVINYNFNMGLNQPTRTPDMASSATYAEFVNQRLVEDNNNPRYTDAEIQKFRDGTDPNYPNTDWYDEVLKNHSSQQMHSLSLRGGAENTLYSISGSYSGSNSMFENGMHNFEGYTIRSNFDTKINEYIGVSMDINAGMDNRIAPGAGNPWDGFRNEPTNPVYWKPGYPSPGYGWGHNPAVMVTEESGKHSVESRRFSSNFGFDIKLPWVEGLGVDGYFVYSANESRDKNWQTPWVVYEYDKNSDIYTPVLGSQNATPTLNQSTTRGSSSFTNLRITYDKQINNHHINAFAGVEQQTGISEYLWGYRGDYMSDLIAELPAGGADSQQNSGYTHKSARQSIIGRLSYNFKEKYLIDFNARYDGSHAFPKGKRFGFFPGVSMAWRMNKEDFLANSDFISDLKLRGSVGQMGNDIIAPYQYLASYSLALLEGYHFGSPTTSEIGLVQGVTPNPNITWEVATNMNIGVDGAFLDNTLGFSFDLFKNRRSNILTKRNLEIPFYTGLTLPDENIGIVDNNGVEIAVFYRNKPSTADGFSYSISGNIALAKSKVIDLSEPQDVPDYQKAEGRILGAGLYYESVGIVRTQEQLDDLAKEDTDGLALYPGSKIGDLYYKDIDNSGVIDAADRVRMDKSNIPNLTYGFNFTLGYKGFSFYSNFAGQGKAWQYFHQNARVGLNGLEELIANRYTPGSMDSKYPNIPDNHQPGAEPSGLRSTFWLQNASFLRLKTVEFGYDLPKDLISKVGLSSLRLYVNGNNLFVLSNIKWFDPETSNELGQFYPQQKVFNFGMNISF